MKSQFGKIKTLFLSTCAVMVIAIFGSPVKAGVSSYSAVKEYNEFLAGVGTGSFSVVYLNNNSVPDMIFDYNNNNDAFTMVYVDGVIGMLDGCKSFYLDRNAVLNNRSIFYYPKKSLLNFYDYNDSSYEDYYYRLSDVGWGETDLWRILHLDSKGIIFQGCTQRSKRATGKTYGSYRDQLLEKWIVRYKISVGKMLSVLDKLTGSTAAKKCTFYANTSANRKKYVNAGSYAAASIKLNKTSVSLKAGQSVILSATVTGKSKSVVWSSSNTSVATVSSAGKVTAKKAGKATITAKANGKTASCAITVSSAKELSGYLGKKLGAVIQAFPNGSKEYKYGIMYWRYQGTHFHGNGEYVPMNDVIISYVSLQGSGNYTLGGMKPGITREKAIRTVTGNGWKFYKERTNVTSGEDLVYGPKNGKYLDLYFEHGLLKVIAYY